MATEDNRFHILRESAPIAVIMLFWTLFSWFGWKPVVATGIRLTGLVIALLYAITQGISLEQTQPHPTDTESSLRTSIRVLLVAGPWFLAAIGTYVVAELWTELGLIGAFTSPADSLAFAFVASGVITAVLYAVAVGLPCFSQASVGVGSLTHCSTA